MRLFFPRRKKQPFRRNSEYLAYFEGKIDQKPRKTSGRLFCMRTSTLARRLRVWEHLFNQTLTQTTHRKRAPFATMTTTKRDFGVVSMWSQVEAAPKVRVLIRFVFYLFRRWGFSAAKDHFVCEHNVLHSVSFREYPFADLSRFVVVALVIIRTQSWGSRNCFTRTKIRRKCSSARALTETITVSL